LGPCEGVISGGNENYKPARTLLDAEPGPRERPSRRMISARWLSQGQEGLSNHADHEPHCWNRHRHGSTQGSTLVSRRRSFAKLLLRNITWSRHVAMRSLRSLAECARR
jgi:hypothetical protein